MSDAHTAVADIPLDRIDVSDPTIHERDCWQPYFERLRAEAPVHYQANGAEGGFWSVSTHDLIKQVDTNHQVFSSGLRGVSITDTPEIEEGSGEAPNSFITMDPPEHDVQRATVAPAAGNRR